MPLFTRAKEEAQPEIPVPEPEPTFLPNAPELEASGLRGPAVHREHLLSFVDSLRPFGIGLQDAAGLTLCEAIVADLDLPTFTAATATGWAVRASNLVGASEQRPVILPVVDEIAAGGYRGAPLSPGTTVRVDQGAPLPDGADAVVPLAGGLAVGDDVQFTREARFQQYLRPAGARIADGDLLLGKGERLTPRALGLIAEVGHDKVLARPRPRVVVLTADSSLVEPGLPLTRLDEVYDACTTLLAATVRDDGGNVFPAGIVPADARALATALSEQLIRADLVLLVTEVTDDLIAMLGRIGAVDVADVDGIIERQAFALVGEERAPVLVLPSAPVAAYLSYLQFGRPLLRKLAGEEPGAPTETNAPVTSEIPVDELRTRLLLGHYTARGVSPVPGEEPGAAELAAANAVIVVPPAGEPIPAHGDVTCWLLD